MPRLLAVLCAISFVLALCAPASAVPPRTEAKSAQMLPAGAKMITAKEARGFIEPKLAAHLEGYDLTMALDEEIMLSNGYSGEVLTLPDGAVIDGNLMLEWEKARYQGKPYRGILALGRLTINGDILNDNWDGGPFLVVMGPLTVQHVFKRGAPMIVFGPITAKGTIYCEYNHGVFRALGGIVAQGVVIDDQTTQFAGYIDAVMVDLYGVDAADALLPQFFEEADEFGRAYPIDDVGKVLKARIRAGHPIFRTDAPRGLR